MRYSTSSIHPIGLAPYHALIGAPYPMQQALTIWQACTATDPIQEDEDDRAARTSIDGNILTPIMVVASIEPTTSTEATSSAPTLTLAVTPVAPIADFEPLTTTGTHGCAITAPMTVIEYKPQSTEASILAGNANAEPNKIKAAHARTDSASSTSSTTSNASTQTTDSTWSSTSIASTAASEVEVPQEVTEECPKKEESPLPLPSIDHDILVFAATIPLPVTDDDDSTSLADPQEYLQEAQPNLDDLSVFELMDHFNMNEDDIRTNSEWDEIMMYEADRQRRLRRAPKTHCQELFTNAPLDELRLPPTSPSNWQPPTQLGSDIVLDTAGLQVDFESFHLDTLPPFDDEVKAVVLQGQQGQQGQPRKLKLRIGASSSPRSAPLRKFQIGGGGKNRLRSAEASSDVSSSQLDYSTIKYTPQTIPRITITEPLEPPSELEEQVDNHPETDILDTSFLQVPPCDSPTRTNTSKSTSTSTSTNFDVTNTESGFEFEQSNFAPSSPRAKEDWLSKWAEPQKPAKKGTTTRSRKATMWTIDPPTAKEAMRVEDEQVFLPAVTTETPRARRLDSFGEDYWLKTPESVVSESSMLSEGIMLEQWREEDDEGFDDVDEEEGGEEGGEMALGGKVEEGTELEEHTELEECTELENLTTFPNQTAALNPLIATLCHKWGPDRFDRWCQEYDTPISEAIWDEAGVALEEFHSEPAADRREAAYQREDRRDATAFVPTPAQDQDQDQNPERRDEVVTRLRTMRLRLERWTESRDLVCYDGAFWGIEEEEGDVE
ncbi:hypothetical protein B0T20DRAFT_502301 [Sordaria brevicollis]|uniref:Uncharacterized protein n=1 Tax=Sordaria brevicollis TaxID=83679 RepID=A0AAE0UA62_SORBR|nr:hypothetical protein B0T20DRAFT_502301 [Sordaria brevicollis]